MHLTDRAMSVTERVRMVASDAHGALSTPFHRKCPCGPKMTAAVSTSADARSAQLHQTSCLLKQEHEIQRLGATVRELEAAKADTRAEQWGLKGSASFKGFCLL